MIRPKKLSYIYRPTGPFSAPRRRAGRCCRNGTNPTLRFEAVLFNTRMYFEAFGLEHRAFNRAHIQPL